MEKQKTTNASDQNSSTVPDPTQAPDVHVFSDDFSPQQLNALHNPKNLKAFLKFGGVSGLLRGLHSDPEDGLRYDAPKDSLPIPKSTRESTFASVTKRTATSAEGTRTVSDLQERRAKFGDNSLPTKKQPNFINLMWGAYNDPVLFLLTAAAAVSLVIGLYQTLTTTHTAANPPVEWVEGVAIIVAIVIIVLVSSINDWEKSRQFQKLNKEEPERDAVVVRGGLSMIITTSDILAGDVVNLKSGDVIPADGILIECYNITCDESSATGEGEWVRKISGNKVYDELTSAGHIDNANSHLDPFILSGTKTMDGVGTFLVTATGPIRPMARFSPRYGKALNRYLHHCRRDYQFLRSTFLGLEVLSLSFSSLLFLSDFSWDSLKDSLTSREGQDLCRYPHHLPNCFGHRRP